MLFEILTLERARDPNALYAPVDARPSVRAAHRNIAPELEAITELGRAVALDPSNGEYFAMLGELMSASITHVARLRRELTQAQIRLAVQAWHWKQLGGRLIGRP